MFLNRWNVLTEAGSLDGRRGDWQAGVRLDCVNLFGRDAAHLAARNGNLNLLKWLKEPEQDADFDLIGPKGDSAFHLAVWYCALVVCNML